MYLLFNFLPLFSDCELPQVAAAHSALSIEIFFFFLIKKLFYFIILRLLIRTWENVNELFEITRWKIRFWMLTHAHTERHTHAPAVDELLPYSTAFNPHGFMFISETILGAKTKARCFPSWTVDYFFAVAKYLFETKRITVFLPPWSFCEAETDKAVESLRELFNNFFFLWRCLNSCSPRNSRFCLNDSEYS